MIEYIVNKEKSTVVAMIRFDEDIDNRNCFKSSDWIYSSLYDALSGLQHKDNWIFNKTYNKQIKKMSFPRVITAKAKCSPNDEWNEEIGKEIARERLVKKIKKYRSESYQIIVDMAQEIVDIINEH